MWDDNRFGGGVSHTLARSAVSAPIMHVMPSRAADVFAAHAVGRGKRMAVSDQQRIGERYELRQTIGIGGMARVYLAYDHLLNREVAMKILNPALAADPTFVERF